MLDNLPKLKPAAWRWDGSPWRAALRSLWIGCLIVIGWVASATGEPIFGEPIRVADGNGGAISTVAGDFNNDGRPEFVSTASKDSPGMHFRIYAFDPATQGFVTYNLLSPAAVATRENRFGGDLDVGDMNNDGFLDIIVPDSDWRDLSGRVSWFENPRGDLGGVWTEHVISTWTGSPGDSVAHMSEVAVGDIDGNGWLDVVTRDVSHGCFILLRSNDGGGWQTRKFVATNPREGLMLWNPDGDGDLDILINGVWLETPADPLYGTYLPRTIAAPWYAANNGTDAIADYACMVGVGDFNGDGRDDIAITNSEELSNAPSTDSKPKGVRVYLSPADPVNGTWTEVVLDPLHFSWHSLEIADIDRDGDLDIVSGISLVGQDNAPANIVAFLNDGTGTVFTQQTIDTGKDSLLADVNLYNATVADADGDGDPDLFAPDNWASGPIRYYENTSTLPSMLPPRVPLAFSASPASAQQIDLAWIDQSDNETGFAIERSMESGEFVQIAETGPGTVAISDLELTPGTHYRYRIRAFNTYGESAYSPEVSATTPVSNLPSAAPAGLSANPISTNRIDLGWTDESDNETGFKIERSINSADFVEIARTGGGVTTFSDSGLSLGTQYAYRVRAFNTYGNSEYSLDASATTLPDVIAPVLNSVSSVTNGTVTAVFSELVERASAETAANYSLSGGAVVNAATLAGDGRTVTLATAGLTSGNTHSLAAIGVRDLSAAQNPSNTAATFFHIAWLSQDIGSVGIVGSMTTSGATITVSGSGADIYGTADGFRFAYRTISGDATVVARVATQTRANAYSKAGVMIRETLGSGSKHALMALTPDFGGEMDYRAATGGTTSQFVYNPATPRVAAPYWVRIVRQGNVLTGSVSANGTAWQQVGTTTVSMTAAVYVGLAVTSHNNSALSTATFDNVSIPGQAVGLSAGPTGLAANVVSMNRIDLAWTDQSTNETGFKIERSTNSAAFVQIAQTGAGVTAFSNLDLAPDTQYRYRVRAFNGLGDTPYSQEASANTPAVIPPPTAPGGLTAIPISTGRIDLHWTDQSTNETGFKIERSTNSAAFVEIAQTGAGITAFTNSGLSPATEFSYRVRAYNASGDSAPSMEVSAITPIPPPPPAAPVSLTANAVSMTRVDLTWIPQSNNQTGFKIERSLDASPFVQIAFTAAGMTGYSDRNLSENTVVIYRVRVASVVGDSEYSEEVSVTTPADTVAPVLQSVSSAADGVITVAFSEPVEKASAEAEESYALSGGVVVNSRTLSPDGRTVTLATTGLVDGLTYTLTATGVRDLSDALNPSSAVATFVHAAWLSQDIGSVAAPGGMVIAPPAITLVGSGADIASTADEFRFAYRSFSGDVAVIARVTSQTRADANSKAGVMIRETLAAGARHVFMALTPDSGGQLLSRGVVNGTTVTVNYNPAITPPVAAPYWVRVVRRGAVVTGSVSNDGVQWQNAGSATISMGATVFVGLAVTSKNDSRLSTARFENVDLHAAVPPAVPAGFEASLASFNTADLAWSDQAATEAGFKIERRTGSGGFVEIAQTGIDVTAFLDLGLIADTAYVYRVRAFNVYGDSAATPEISVTTPPDPFLGWQYANFGPEPDPAVAGNLQDPDRDSILNVFEYFHGTDPNATETGAPVRIIGGDRLTLAFERSVAAFDVTATVQVADDVSGVWTDIARSVDGREFTALVPGVGISEAGGGTIRTVQISDFSTVTDPAHPSRFMRLHLSR
ncbi:MAG: fibronectin type III domain-containing protein [Chthoniobacteraceae bacterium]